MITASGFGTFDTCRLHWAMSAFRGNPEDICSHGVLLSLTHLRHRARPANRISAGRSDDAGAHQLYFNRVSCEGIAGCGTEGADAIMKTKYTLALAMVAGVGIGAAAVQALHAQTKPPAYAVVELEVQNPDEFKKEFLPLASKVFSEAGGKFLARPGIATAIDGTAPNRVALIAFDSRRW
jgi:Domain of unknown function (DUF1330)